MQFLKVIYVLLGICFILLCGKDCYSLSINPEVVKMDMKQRIEAVKKSTVRIFVNGLPSGSGFVLEKDGLVATCFHVVQQAQPAANGQTQIIYANNIQVELFDGRKVTAQVDKSSNNQHFMDALSKDFCLLKVNGSSLPPGLKLGSFSDAEEGSQVYLSGLPMGIDQVVVAVGMISTKWKAPGYLGQGSTRDVAWVDITMNRGNSGGPMLLIGEKPEDDKVIGLSTFILNPFAEPSERVINLAQSFPGNVHIMGIDFKAFSTLIGSALASNSIGISGIVSIDYIRDALKNA